MTEAPKSPEKLDYSTTKQRFTSPKWGAGETLIALLGTVGGLLAAISGLDRTVQIILGSSVAIILIGTFFRFVLLSRRNGG